jgi:hypothetical protein
MTAATVSSASLLPLFRTGSIAQMAPGRMLIDARKFPLISQASGVRN